MGGNKLKLFTYDQVKGLDNYIYVKDLNKFDIIVGNKNKYMIRDIEINKTEVTLFVQIYN